jgi:hypothetical protein
MTNFGTLGRTLLRSAVTAVVVSAGPLLPMPAVATASGTTPISQVVGPLVHVYVPCPAPFDQGGVAGAHSNACNAVPVFQ